MFWGGGQERRLLQRCDMPLIPPDHASILGPVFWLKLYDSCAECNRKDSEVGFGVLSFQCNRKMSIDMAYLNKSPINEPSIFVAGAVSISYFVVFPWPSWNDVIVRDHVVRFPWDNAYLLKDTWLFTKRPAQHFCWDSLFERCYLSSRNRWSYLE